MPRSSFNIHPPNLDRASRIPHAGTRRKTRRLWCLKTRNASKRSIFCSMVKTSKHRNYTCYTSSNPSSSPSLEYKTGKLCRRVTNSSPPLSLSLSLSFTDLHLLINVTGPSIWNWSAFFCSRKVIQRGKARPSIHSPRGSSSWRTSPCNLKEILVISVNTASLLICYFLFLFLG